MTDKKKTEELRSRIEQLEERARDLGLLELQKKFALAKILVEKKELIPAASNVVSLSKKRQQLCQLIYVSCATEIQDVEELLLLLSEVRVKNVQSEITGLLVYGDNSFLQVIEGKKGTVLDLFSRIKRDTRHNQIRVVLQRDIEGRSFESWSMGFRRLKKNLRREDVFRLTRENLESYLPSGHSSKDQTRTLFFNFYEALDTEGTECAISVSQ